ncbi:uracil phosphoribosyltransferase [Catalinimonas alkaloidigena]|uniref:Uracil phosphoribosyltransferase n=1 Tax=Catalinimonas alkaloidigena TaxID=1075417 RepID=A0A1G9QNM0_9BACT|nr:uracil phosphoribosyltransferase [Catalinimonas alkaloidigena]SDM12167.1 uracil phosphoribosyltransferase [Catalinimonas alkaloidigena]
MSVFVLNKHASVANHFLAELRSKDIQRDRWRFRRNLERLGEVLAYELSKALPYDERKVTTPLGESEVQLMNTPPVLIPVLRAALPFYQGLLNFFDQADSGFIAAYRGVPHSDASFDIHMDYVAAPQIEDRVTLLIDPMLATGRSLVRAWETIHTYGQPKQLHVVAAIATQTGIDWVRQYLPEATIWTGAVDPTLNAKSYIVPGLGDAGDLAFGEKN